MALPIKVKELIDNRVVESTRIEYKADWDPEPIIHSITAFANDIDNSGGGYIVVGIAEENGMPKIPVTGLNKGSIDRIQKELLNKCNLIEPRYLPVVEPSTYDGKDILIIWAPGGDDRPYTDQGGVLREAVLMNTYTQRDLVPGDPVRIKYLPGKEKSAVMVK